MTDWLDEELTKLIVLSHDHELGFDDADHLHLNEAKQAILSDSNTGDSDE